MSFYEKNLRQIYKMISVFYGHLSRFLEPIIQLPPMRYMIYITTQCNFSCNYCHVLTGLNQKQERLTLDEWTKIAKKILPFSIVSISGGEPLLAKETLPLINLLKNRGIFVTMVTNGSLLTKRRLEEIAAAGLNYLMISLDGLGDTHDSNRQVRGSFDKIESSLMLIEKNFSIKVGIKSVISDQNHSQLIELIKFCERFSCIKDLQFAVLFDNPLNGGFNSFDQMDDDRLYRGNSFSYENKSEVIESLRLILEYKKESKLNINFTFEGEEVDDIYRFIEEPRSYGVKECLIPWTDVSIHANGEVTPCLSYKLGNIRDHDYSPMRLLSKTRARNFKKFIRQNPFLPACEGCTIVPKHEKKV